MLHREDSGGLLVLSQLTHAWVAGQLARAWGNEEFGKVEPREEVCLAADLHDIGWTRWEQAPMLNPRTGRPYTFMEIPRRTHLEIWSAGGPSALTWGRYTALLVSAHGTALYERRKGTSDSAEETQLIKESMSRWRELEDQLLQSLQADAQYAPFVAAAALKRNQRLIGVWDHLSLVLGMGLRMEQRIDRVPATGGETAITVKPTNTAATEFSVTPWPFAVKAVAVECEARRLPECYSDEDEMRAALARAPWVKLKVELRPR
jgi:hypothetical protein